MYCSGTTLTDPAADNDHAYKRDWARLGFNTAWVQLANNNNNMYFSQTDAQCKFNTH